MEQNDSVSHDKFQSFLSDIRVCILGHDYVVDIGVCH